MANKVDHYGHLMKIRGILIALESTTLHF